MAESIYEAAKGYLARGWSVIPIQPRGKKPLVDWETYNSRLPTEQELAAWWKKWPNANVAIVTGRISGIVIADVDVDKGGDPAVLFEHAPTGTLMQTGSGGAHFYYDYPTGKERVPNSVGKKGYDVRADGGYVVAPPSIHPNGNRYKVVQTGPTETFTPAIRAALDELNGTRTVPDSDGKKPQEEWLSNLLRGVSSGGRNDACARLSGYFASKGLPQDIVLAMMHDWNAKNNPPLPKSEISTTVVSIFKSEYHKRKNGTVAHDETAKITTMPFGAYMTKYGGEKIRWIIEGWLPESTVAFVISPPGSFKTWTMLDLAESVASGREFLGQFPVLETGPALVIQQEDFHGALVSRLSTIIAAKDKIDFTGGTSPDDFEFQLPRDIPVHFHPDRALKFDNPAAMASLEEKIAEIRPKVVIIDPLYAAGRVDDYMAKTAEQMLPLKQMRDRYGCSFLVVHHTKKQTEGAAIREGAWGSQFLNAFLETGWQIRPVGEEGTNDIVVSRHFKVSANPPPIQVSFAISTDAPYAYSVTCGDVTSVDKKNHELVAIIEKHGPIGAKEIAEKIGKHRSTITRKLKKMVDDGVIARDKDDLYTVPSMPAF